MFESLLASHAPGRSLGWGFSIAVALHAAALGVLLRPTVKAQPVPFLLPETAFPHDGPIDRAPAPGPIILDLPPNPIILNLPGLEPMPALPTVPTSWGDSSTGPSSEPWPVSTVPESPVLLTVPLPAYPSRLREAGIQGQVIVEAVVDTLGRVDPGSVRVVSSDHVGFNSPAVMSIGAGLFRPARVFGRAVRVRVTIPVSFRLR